MNRRLEALLHFSFALLAFATLPLHAQSPAAPWVQESNRHAEVLLETMAKYQPEDAASAGVEGHDERIFDLRPGRTEREVADLRTALTKLESARKAATDRLVAQDLDILIDAAQDQIRTLELEHRLLLPYFDLGQALFGSFQNLLDERIAKERWPAALTRLRRYAGREPGYQPITALFRARFEERMGDASLTGPWAVQVEQNLANQGRYVQGIRQLLERSGLRGWQRDFDALSKQLDEHAAWVRSTVLPRARKTHRLPAEIYANNLRNFGVEMDPRELIERALFSYVETRNEMQIAAKQLAAGRGWKLDDYRDVIRELKKQRIPNDRLLETYRSRLDQIEEAVRRERIVTLPEREAVIRLATEAESAAQPAPHVDPPRLIGNTGEPAEFVLPLSNPNAAPGAEMDDFIHGGITWTLTAHEARPGHELQFAKMLERGVSTARVVFAFNSANVEGWALYAEALMQRHLPLEGQIGALQMRMMRAARAFLDPMLNLGMIEPEAALRLLMDEVVLSEPMAKQEVDRYTFRMPGQATAYFYGYATLQALRARAEIALGERFGALAYHDFIVGQGLLPLDVLERTVMEDFVRPQLAAPGR